MPYYIVKVTEKDGTKRKHFSLADTADQARDKVRDYISRSPLDGTITSVKEEKDATV